VDSGVLGGGRLEDDGPARSREILKISALGNVASALPAVVA